jgi:hypothetical protein
MVCHDQERFDDAVFAYEQAIVFDPNMAVAHQNYGKTLGRLRKFDEAITCFERAITLSPTYLNAYKNKARALYFRGDLDAALAVHEQVLTLAPGDTETHMNRGMIWLARGNTAAGWREYEWRWKMKDGALPALTQPLWNGETLDGKSILLTPEQGLGDSIQFIRYGAVLKQRYKCRVLFHCPRPLVQLLSTCGGIDELIDGRTSGPQTDCFAPLLHVPAMLRHGPADFPANVPYLMADQALVEQWARRLAAYQGRKIGIAWRGSPQHPADRMRSIPLAEFAQLAKIPEVQIFSLQKGPGSEELKSAGSQISIVDLGRELDERTGAFVETAAVLKNLDLLIACDTAVGHVAGALGVPTWLALNNVPDWRWLEHRGDSPSYPSLRLFRQNRFGDWQGVFGRIAESLRMLGR